MSETIKISEEIAVKRLKRFIDECDADELARILGNIFGGSCFTDDAEVYEFLPDKYYAGEFDDLQDGK